MVLQLDMDVTDTEHDPRYESPLTYTREGLLIEVKEEKDPLLLTYSELVKENEVSCTYPSSEMLQSSTVWECRWHNKTIHLHFTNTCTCESHSISVNTLILKINR